MLKTKHNVRKRNKTCVQTFLESVGLSQQPMPAEMT